MTLYSVASACYKQRQKAELFMFQTLSAFIVNKISMLFLKVITIESTMQACIICKCFRFSDVSSRDTLYFFMCKVSNAL